jgi:hypothetical protein
MARIRLIVVGLLVVLFVAGVSAASAYASPLWVVKGKGLKSSETSKAVLKFGKSTIKWEDKSTKTKFKVECKNVSGKVELKGGEPGTDKLQAFAFEECVLVEGASGCKITIGGVTAEELPGWPSELKTSGGKFYDIFTGIKFSLILEKCEKVSFSKTWLFEGNLKAEVTNEAEKIKTVFPTTALEGDTLKSEGAEALLSTEGKLEEEAGGALEIKEGSPPPPSPRTWEECLNEHTGTGTKYLDSHCKEESVSGTWEWMPIEKELSVTSEGGAQTFTIPSAGTTITCQKILDDGNLLPEGKSGITKILYHECTINIAGCSVVKTAGQPNGLIEMPPTLKTELVSLTAGEKLLAVDLVAPATPPTFVVLEVGKKEKEGKAEGACGVLAVKDEVKGTFTAMVEGQNLNFVGEGTLTIDGLSSEYRGEDKQTLTNGNLFRASS